MADSKPTGTIAPVTLTVNEIMGLANLLGERAKDATCSLRAARGRHTRRGGGKPMRSQVWVRVPPVRHDLVRSRFAAMITALHFSPAAGISAYPGAVASTTSRTEGSTITVSTQFLPDATSRRFFDRTWRCPILWVADKRAETAIRRE